MTLRTSCLLLLLLQLMNARSSWSIKTYCKTSDNTCDDFWTPLSNLEASLVGYDLPTGNPFASNFIEDPGLRKQIFNATIKDSDTYKLEPGITIREYDMCDKEFTTKVTTNLLGYKKVRMT